MRKFFSALILLTAIFILGCESNSTSNTNTPGGSCASGSTSMTFDGTANASSPHKKGDVVCFTASATSLSFSGKTLTSPVQGGVTPPYSSYTFKDATAKYEVILNSGAPYEINVIGNPDTTVFYGQFTPTP